MWYLPTDDAIDADRLAAATGPPGGRAGARAGEHAGAVPVRLRLSTAADARLEVRGQEEEVSQERGPRRSVLPAGRPAAASRMAGKRPDVPVTGVGFARKRRDQI